MLKCVSAALDETMQTSKRRLLYFQEKEILSFLGEMGVRDGISQEKKMSVDNQPFDPVHKNKLQKLLSLAIGGQSSILDPRAARP